MCEHISAIVAACLGGVWLAAAIAKSLDPAPTLTALGYAYGRLGFGGAFASFAAYWLLLVIEVLLASRMIAGVRVAGALVVSSLLIVMMSAWSVWLESDGASIGCGCGLSLHPGEAHTQLGASLVRNSLLLGLSLAGLGVLHIARVPAREAQGRSPHEQEIHERPAYRFGDSS